MDHRAIVLGAVVVIDCVICCRQYPPSSKSAVKLNPWHDLK
jgi:hypothetical protein